MSTVSLCSRVSRYFTIHTFQPFFKGAQNHNPFCRSSSSSPSSKKVLDLLHEMPKDMRHVEKLQKQRQAKKLTKTVYPPSTVRLQVLGTGATGAPRSLYLFTDQKWYNHIPNK